MAGTAVRVVPPVGFSERFSLHHRTKRNQADGDVAAATPSSQQLLGRGIDVGATRNNARSHY